MHVLTRVNDQTAGFALWVTGSGPLFNGADPLATGAKSKPILTIVNRRPFRSAADINDDGPWWADNAEAVDAPARASPSRKFGSR
jgi:hypothetical protein